MDIETAGPSGGNRSSCTTILRLSHRRIAPSVGCPSAERKNASTTARNADKDRMGKTSTSRTSKLRGAPGWSSIRGDRQGFRPADGPSSTSVPGTRARQPPRPGRRHGDETGIEPSSVRRDTHQYVAGLTGDGKTWDGFEDEFFHYLMANPPFGVEWKDQKEVVEREHRTMGLSGRFGAGLPAINDGSLLFLQHMISKMHPYEEGDEDQPGSKIAIVFNGSPLFAGDAGSGPSNIRRWIIENDWLDAIVALPDQLFYNTGIFTYVWLVTNRKPRSGAARCSSSTAPASSRR